MYMPIYIYPYSTFEAQNAGIYMCLLNITKQNAWGTWRLYIAMPQTHISGFSLMVSLFNIPDSCPENNCEDLEKSENREKKLKQRNCVKEQPTWD